MRVEINGETREIEPGSSVTALLHSLGLEGRPVAVERNAAIVPRVEHASTLLVEGDRLELVQFVGGG
jgi:thiamine biosynthesis protein ThiS